MQGLRWPIPNETVESVKVPLYRCGLETYSLPAAF